MAGCLLATAGVAVWVCALLALPVLFAMAALAWLPLRPSSWLWCLASLIPVLLVDALHPSLRLTRLARIFGAVRAFACLPPYAVLAVVLVHVPMNTRAWVGGMDSMFQPVTRIDDVTHSYVVVRSDPMAFTRPTLRILVTTPLVPGVLGWWRELGSMYNVRTADLHVDGDELCVDYHYFGTDSESRPLLQRRFRIR